MRTFVYEDEIEDSYEIRFVMFDNSYHAVATDIAAAIGFATPSHTAGRYCKNKKRVVVPEICCRPINIITLDEMMRFIEKVKAAGYFYTFADELEQWLEAEVLPALQPPPVPNVNTQYNSSVPQVPDSFQDALRQLADALDREQVLLMKLQNITEVIQGGV